MATGYPVHEPLMHIVSGAGVPYAGAKANFYLAGTSTRADTYTTRAMTTPNANPVVADSSGRFGPIFLDPDVVYKIDITDSAGVSVPGYPIDGYTIKAGEDQASLGTKLFPRTGAEASAGINEYTALNTVGHITRPWIRPGNALRYGADPSGSQDSQPALQAAINAASYAHDSADEHPGEAYWPMALYRCASDLYGEYDAANNPNHAAAGDGSQNGRVTLRGDACGGQNDLPQGRYRASVIKFDPGYKFIVCTGSSGSSGSSVRGLFLEDFAVSADVDDFAMICRYMPDGGLQRLKVHNANTGSSVGGIDFEDIWIGYARDIYVTGPHWNQTPAWSGANPGTRTSAVGIGVRYRPTAAGGGDWRWENVNANGFDVGLQFGNDYADRNGKNTNIHLWLCQGQYCRVGIEIKADIASGVIHEQYNEFCHPYGTNHGAGLLIHHSAGKGKLNADTNLFGGILVIGGQHGSDYDGTLSGYYANMIQLGSDSSDPYEAAHGPVKIIMPNCPQSSNGVQFLRRYNSPLNGPVELESPQFSWNGGKFIVLEDEAQTAPFYVKDVSGLKYLRSDRWVQPEGSTADISKWVSGDIAAFYEAGDATYDLTGTRQMPDIIRSEVATGETHTIKLPSWGNMADRPTHILKLDSADGAIVLDPTAPGHQTSTAYETGAIVENGGELYYCITAGITGASSPPTGTTPGASIVDGTANWTWIDTATSHTINGTAATFTIDAGNGSVLVYPQRRHKNSLSVIDWQVRVVVVRQPHPAAPPSGVWETEMEASLIAAGIIEP